MLEKASKSSRHMFASLALARTTLNFKLLCISIILALDNLSTVQYMQIKTGDVRVLANVSFLLVKKDWSSEIRLHAFKMLQVYTHLPLLFSFWWRFLMLLWRIYPVGILIRILKQPLFECEDKLFRKSHLQDHQRMLLSKFLTSLFQMH